ncbi:sentrin-specific protease 8 isoform X1 [Carcharodon carcharias]|uniref:sentrin-specific protease 8 isoform X1 n=2 Tax=Carcharodon carcharias TaxID=13397 RepID=UPI001B7EAE3C|nr:sentrin-specific protease 8 isoform X1 [Carcharodon carcharias]
MAAPAVRNSMDPVILSYHDSLIRRSDLSLLNPPNWLNDHIIAFAFEYFATEQYKELLGSACFISPEVTQFIKCMASQQELAIFLEPLALAEKSLVFLAVNDNSVQAAGGSHWSLLFYNRDGNCFSHYDSCSNMNASHARQIAKKLQHFLGTKSEVPFVEEPAPVQKNSYDCGMYVMCNTEALCEQYLRRDRRPPMMVVTPTYITQKRANWKKLIEQLSKK